MTTDDPIDIVDDYNDNDEAVTESLLGNSDNNRTFISRKLSYKRQTAWIMLIAGMAELLLTILTTRHQHESFIAIAITQAFSQLLNSILIFTSPSDIIDVEYYNWSLYGALSFFCQLIGLISRMILASQFHLMFEHHFFAGFCVSASIIVSFCLILAFVVYHGKHRILLNYAVGVTSIYLGLVGLFSAVVFMGIDQIMFGLAILFLHPLLEDRYFECVNAFIWILFIVSGSHPLAFHHRHNNHFVPPMSVMGV